MIFHCKGEKQMYSYQINNMKSFIDSGEVEIKPITIFIGKNSSGKSSLVRFPMVLKQTIEERISPLLFYGNYIDYGNYEDIVFNHNENENVAYSFKIEIEDLKKMYKNIGYGRGKSEYSFEEFLGNTSRENQDFKVAIEVGRQITNKRYLGSLEVKNYYISLGEKKLFEVIKDNNSYKTYINEKYEKELEVIFVGSSPRIPLQKLTEESDEGKDVFFFRDLLMFIDIYLSNTISNISYIGPFRRIPDRNYRYQEANNLSISSDGSYTSELLASYHRKNDIKFFITLNNWLEEHLRIHIEVEDLKGGMYRIVVNDLLTGVKNNIIDVGFGLSQVLPIIIQVLQRKQDRTTQGLMGRRVSRLVNRITIVEQPELHLHPDAQSNLADLFIKGSEIDSQNRFIIETHSEHLILRLRRRILEGTISAEKVAIYHVEKDFINNLGSIVKKLEIDSKGDINEWPTDFFDQDYKEIMQINRLKANKNKGEEEW